MADFSLAQGAVGTVLNAQVTSAAGTPANLTLHGGVSSVQLIWGLIGGSIAPATGTGAVVNAAQGLVKHTFSVADASIVGTYNAQWLITYVDATTDTFPSTSYFTIQIVGATQAGRTLYDLVRSVSINMGDLEEGTLTGAADTTHPADSGRTDPLGWETGSNLALVGPTFFVTNQGVERKVNDYQTPGAFLTNAFPALPHAGDKYELRRYPLHTRNSVIEFINQAIREVRRQSWIALDSRTDLGDLTTYTIDKLEYTVPAKMEMVHTVLYLDIAGQPTTTLAALPATGNVGDYWYVSDTQAVLEWSGVAWIPSTRVPWIELRYDWWTTNVTGTILIQEAQDFNWDVAGFRSPMPSTAPIRFKGSARPNEMHNETDVTYIEGNYVEVFASARTALRLARGNQDQADFNNKFQTFYKLEADAFRGTRRGLPSGSRKVR